MIYKKKEGITSFNTTIVSVERTIQKVNATREKSFNTTIVSVERENIGRLWYSLDGFNTTIVSVELAPS